VYREHIAKICGLGLPPERLLEWTVKDGRGSLCQFLGKPVPEEPFPSGNATEAFDQRLNKAFKLQIQYVFRNLALFLAVLGAFMSAMVYKWRW